MPAVVATVIGAAIPVLIVGVVVWFGITNDRKERLDRRLDEAAVSRSRSCRADSANSKSPSDQDAVITVRHVNGAVTSNTTVTLPELPAGYADTYINGVRYRVRSVTIAGELT